MMILLTKLPLTSYHVLRITATAGLLFSSRQPPSKKKTMHSCSASSGKPDSNSLDCIVFFALWYIVIEIGGGMRRFTFLVSDVSMSWVYLLSQISPQHLLSSNLFVFSKNLRSYIFPADGI